MEGDVRLAIENLTEFYTSVTEYEDYYFIKDELARGRVEVCIGGKYGTICDSQWDDKLTPAVICSQLGFSYFGKHNNIIVSNPSMRSNNLFRGDTCV